MQYLQWFAARTGPRTCVCAYSAVLPPLERDLSLASYSEPPCCPHTSPQAEKGKDNGKGPITPSGRGSSDALPSDFQVVTLIRMPQLMRLCDPRFGPTVLNNGLCFSFTRTIVLLHGQNKMSLGDCAPSRPCSRRNVTYYQSPIPVVQDYHVHFPTPCLALFMTFA